MPRLLGKKPAVLDPRVPALHRMMSARIVVPPVSNWYAAVGDWAMLGNDTWGDCVVAGALHSITQRTTYAGKPQSFSNGDALSLYERWGNYNPAVPSSDEGCIMSDAMALWIKDGVPFGSDLDKPDSYVTINIKNMAMVQLAISLTGSAMLGIACPEAWLETDYLMDVGPDGTVGEIAGGHCILAVGYKTEPKLGGLVLDVISWGARYAMTWRAAQQVLDEAYTVMDRDWFSDGTAGVDPAGVNWAALNAAMNQIKAS